MSRVTGLRERWNDLIPGAAELADDLTARYRADDRRAYREQYLQRVLDALGTLDQLSTDPTAVYLAAWFHRAVHERGGQNDAEASASLAEETLPSYQVTAARTAEVARLVRLTGTPPPWSDALSDPNAYVLLDAVNATAAGPSYATHASEVRRDASDRLVAIRQRHALVQRLLDGPIYRTQLARDRYAAAARANLRAELEILDGEIPAPWRGWQRAALIGVATVCPLIAAVAAFGATSRPWQYFVQAESVWPVWLLVVVSLGAVFLLHRFARSGGNRAKLVTGVFSAAALVGLTLAIELVPRSDPSTGPAGRVPLVIISLLLLVLGGVAALGSASLGGPLPARNRGQVLAGVTAAAVVAAGTVFVADPIGRDFVLKANEHLTGSVASEVTAPRSELDGRPAWVSPTTSVQSDAVNDAVATRYGIAISRQTGSVELLDPTSGEVRWSYRRGDTDVRPELHPTGDGRLLLANFEDIGTLLLDASTGQRKAAWPASSRDHTIEYADPLLTGEQVSRGSDKLRGVDPDGKARWTFEPGRCTSIGATATADTVVTFLGHSCGRESDEMTALDLRTGKQLWTRPASWSGVTRLVFDGLIVALEAREGTPGFLVGMEARTGEVKWRWELPTAWGCDTKLAAAGRQVVLLNCPSAATRRSAMVATVLDGRTGDLAWQRTVAGDLAYPVTITEDARVLSLRETGNGCDLTVLAQAAHRRVTLPEDVICRRGIHALGNQLLVSGADTVIALR